jgi:outer membrane cobalamin receptor
MCASLTSAGGIQTLDIIEVVDSRENLLGIADSANEGTVLKKQLEARTAYRPGELLEITPGLIVTQHSGEGKAGQYYLRGFNLDHGSDLRITVDGMLVNQRSHGHGHGWSDLNFLIPELVSNLQYKKGPYYADEGDFSSAGAVIINYADTLKQGIADATTGERGYRRFLLADSPKIGNGNLLYALELLHNDGPFTNPEDFSKFNGVLRYSHGSTQDGFNLTAMTYTSKGNATNQIPKRAVESGLLSRFDSLDPSDGSETSRYSLSGAWRRAADNSFTKANLYIISHDLALYSNFTYYLDDPVNGDQFEQPDRRVMSGFNTSHEWFANWGSYEVENTIGLQLQNDDIFVGLYRTKKRELLSVTRSDHIVESSAGVYFQNSLRWSDKFRTLSGARSDFYRFNVASDNPANSGTVIDNIINPKFSMIFGPWSQTEFFINMGGGFHSNDARGTTITKVPGTGANANLPAKKVPPLVHSRGYEVGVRTAIVAGLQSSLTSYILDFDSELVFAGDAGTTSAGRSSRRIGFEFTNYYTPTTWLTVDADFSYANARFTAPDPDPTVKGDYIPCSVEGVGSISASVDKIGNYFGSLQLRYFGPRALIEDNSMRSGDTTLLNGRIGYKFGKNMTVTLEGFNLLDNKANAIDYYYTSRLSGEPADGVADIHFHPIEPRSFRLSAIYYF